MTQEMWINTLEEYQDFLSYINEEKVAWFSQGEDSEGNRVIKTDKIVVHIPNKYDIPETPTKLQKQLETTNEEFEAVKPLFAKYDKLIYGKDFTEFVTNITVDNEQVFIYKSDGSVEIKEYYNWAVGAHYSDGCQRLKGSQYYKYIKELPEDQWYMLKDNWNPSIWTPRTAAEGFMLRSGMTYYKGMKATDVSLLSFDLEATSLDKDHPEAEIPLLSVTYRSRTGAYNKRLFDMFEFDSKRDMFQSINSHVNNLNPDVILGHNILSYDLPYLDKNSDGISWGKDGSRILFEEKVSKKRKDGSQSYEFHNANIHGREIVDTFFLALTYDIGREFPGYGLKAIEKHLGYVKEDRSWDFQTWPVKKLIEAKKAGNHEIWQKFREYCQDDSDSPIKMFDLMIPSFFYLAQSVPKTLQQMVNEASGSQLDSLMIRSYLQDGFGLPRSSKKVDFEGAVTMGIPGIYKNVKKVDVASLYPSIMLEYNIYDKYKDPNANMPKILEFFRTDRLNNKRLAKETKDKYFDDLQNAQKILINSLYGYLGAGFLLFNYPEGAAEVTRRGREILLKGVEWSTGHTLEKSIKKTTNKGKENEEDQFHWILGAKVCDGLGYQLVNVDTDSFSYTNNNPVVKEEFDVELAELNSLYPKLISWEKDGEDGVFDEIVVVAAKNYVLVRNGKVKYKGSSFKSSQKEPIMVEMLHKFMDELRKTNDIEKLKSYYTEYCKLALNPPDIKPWCKKKTITEAVLTSDRPNETKILDACNNAIAKGIIAGIQEGDKIYLYQALDGMVQAKAKGELKFSKKGEPVMVENTIQKFPELYIGDHDMWHYVERIHDTLCILENIVDITQFEKYHLVKNREKLG